MSIHVLAEKLDGTGKPQEFTLPAGKAQLMPQLEPGDTHRLLVDSHAGSTTVAAVELPASMRDVTAKVGCQALEFAMTTQPVLEVPHGSEFDGHVSSPCGLTHLVITHTVDQVE